MARLFVVIGIVLALVACSGLGPSTTESYLSPTKSVSDSYQYRYLTLDNSLEVLLISDPDAIKGAASLNVMVGSGENPMDRGGLAHFLEHMLFQGTEKYPDAGEYSEFIGANGGAQNAYTSSEHTNYYFDVKAEVLDEALDRFSQFFIAPLLDPKYVDLEKNAVEAEYQMGLNSDGRRWWDVLREIANTGHPYSRFGVGNLESLADRPGQNIRDDLRAFYEEYYDASQMKLVVLGPQDLDTLQAMVQPKFNAVPDRDSVIEDIAAPIFDPEVLPTLVVSQPTATSRSLEILFPMPSDYRDAYDSKPLAYLGSLLGDEGPGSLLSYFKSADLAESVGAGAGIKWRGGSMFYVSVGLTEKGVEEWQTIVSSVFAYIDLINAAGPEAWRFEQQRQLAESRFRFREDMPASQYVTGLSEAMHYYAAEDVLSGPVLLETYQPELIEQALSYLNPDNMVAWLSAPGVETDQTSEFYGVDYAVSPLTADTFLAQPALAASQLQLPAENPFIASDFSLVELDPDYVDKPVQLVEEDRTDLWFMQDDEFAKPKGMMTAKFEGGHIRATPKDAAVVSLYAALVNDATNELAYPAGVAGLGFSISSSATGIRVQLNGYNEKQKLLLDELLPYLQQTEFAQQRFDALKTEAIRSLRNVVTSAPYSQTLNDARRLMLSGQFSEADRIEAMETVTLDDVVNFAREFWATTSVTALVYGNYTTSDAEAFANTLSGLIGSDDPVAPRDTQVTRIRPGEHLRYVRELEHNDAVVFWYTQGPAATFEDRAKTSLATFTTERAFFDSLRTEQQLGYVVASFNWVQRGVPGSGMLVQSPSHSATAVVQAMSEFRRQHAENLTEEEFLEYRDGLVVQLLEPPKNLYEKGGRLWAELDLGELDFDTQKQIADLVVNVEYDELLDYYREHFLDNAAWIQVIAPGKRGELPSEPSATRIDDAISFRSVRQGGT
ncbi:peptidase M16 domain protein [Luminiphilus syltensis NOR5-1B]|uniref:Protease 3 n=1 Tax=Luminiphilus syltensis NOR5-1B TaxID=565045 RepID=B8KWW9_9GAMM|nr:insulinase family protein [Luminiphilus syltensis]EED35297.1 peptidase M16 domain protein [Luminiphilus syltensis NOR5-1B]